MSGTHARFSPSSAERRLFISFSGGETSAFMTYAILYGAYRHRYDDIRVVFANTGQERDETLEFVKQCDEHFGFNTVWVEAEVHHGQRTAPTSRVVTYDSADREGRVFESAIQKYGIPNSKFKSCTRDLKLRPMTHYLKSIGWEPGTYDTAIGIRVDEIDRMSDEKEKRRLVYPLIEWIPTTKPQINHWWDSQPFRLSLKSYEGNCKWCWKKSFRKHYTLLSENPSIYDFPDRMEKLYGRVGPEFSKPGLPDGYRRTFFRTGKSVEDLKFDLDCGVQFVPAGDDSLPSIPFDPALDVGAGCEESCEVHADEDSADDWGGL
jgi:hypothetical protein